MVNLMFLRIVTLLLNCRLDMKDLHNFNPTYGLRLRYLVFGPWFDVLFSLIFVISQFAFPVFRF